MFDSFLLAFFLSCVLLLTFIFYFSSKSLQRSAFSLPLALFLFFISFILLKERIRHRPGGGEERGRLGEIKCRQQLADVNYGGPPITNTIHLRECAVHSLPALAPAAIPFTYACVFVCMANPRCLSRPLTKGFPSVLSSCLWNIYRETYIFLWNCAESQESFVLNCQRQPCRCVP